MPGPIFRVRAELLHVKPAIWRQMEVPGSRTLTGLHRVLQQAMGWDDSYLWAFRAGDRHFEKARPGTDHLDGAEENPDDVTVSDLLSSIEDSLLYHYDFGDDWMILVSFEAKAAPEADVRYPRCISGERAGPPEDCGGPPGFDELLAARRNPRLPGAKDLLRWAGPGWNPEAFELDAINKALSSVRASAQIH